MEQRHSESKEEFQRTKTELSQLRSALNQVHDEKEKAYHELQAWRMKLHTLTDKIRVLKQERNQFTIQVQSTKAERETLHQAEQQQRLEKQHADEKKKELITEVEVRQSPRAVQAQIKRLETKIETEVLPFTKEQELMKVIKGLKARYKQLEQWGKVWNEAHTATEAVVKTHRLAQERHKKVQDLAQQSHHKHEEVQVLYDEVKKLRAQEKSLVERYQQGKQQYTELQKKYDEILQKYTQLNRIFREHEEQSFSAKIREKTAAVQEKLKQGKKLNMDDILTFQAGKG